MPALKNTFEKLGIALVLSSLIAVPATYANDTSEANARLEALSYAPEGSPQDERFSQFELETDEYYEHELNDAWLGMPAYSSNGELVGYIDDAILDGNGDVANIIVGLNGGNAYVEINGELAELDSEKVQVELSNTQIAELARTGELAALEN